MHKFKTDRETDSPTSNFQSSSCSLLVLLTGFTDKELQFGISKTANIWSLFA